MIKSILIPIDGSPSSKSVLEIGLSIAEVSRAKIKVLYVEDMLRLLEWQPVELMAAAVTTSSYIPHGRPTVEQVEIEKEFMQEESYLSKLFEDVFSKTNLEKMFLTKRGKVDEVIVNYSKTVDLVIIGKRSSKTFPRDSKEPGPVTENLLRHTTRPVMVVPEGAKLNKHVLIGYDGSKTAQRALSIGALFATLFKSKVTVVSVTDDIDKADKPLSEAKEFLAPYNLDVDYVVDFDSSEPWNAILEQASNFKVGLIAIGAYGENKLLELIFGSTTKQVLTQAQCPVLLCR